MKTILTATAVSALMVTGALADCPGGQPYTGGVANTNGSFGFGPNFSINSGVKADWFDSGNKTDGACATAAAISVGTGVAVTGEIIPNTATPATDDGIYVPGITAVYGERSTAVGHGAVVGNVETYTEGGVDGVGDDPTTLADESANDYTATRLLPVNGGTALGAGAQVKHEGSTAVGAGAKSTDTNQVTLGTDKDTVRAPGITSQTSKDRQVGSLEVVTSDSEGRLATDGGAIYNQLDSHSSTLNAHTALLSDHSARLDEHAKGLAIAMSLPDLYLTERERFSIAGNLGGFGDETGIGAGIAIRLDQNWSLNGKLGADIEFKEFGWSVGARAGF
jgi:trimeric autotransporter adhesin